jgi:hypothetical protein
MQLNRGLVERSAVPYFSDFVWVNEFFKMSKLGRHAYIITYIEDIFRKAPEAVVVDDSSFYTNKKIRVQIHYLSKKKELLKATPAGVGFLLKTEKDLYEAYQNEKTINKEVMRKYLDKMNDLHPDWEPDSKYSFQHFLHLHTS